ncbi:MAG: GtrA family protein [Candidatus Devosia phytovorans]|uniref:GtrA family protein n=1 Tax=Candidatus Devosia phytovorans TaxID=3121372 RepID=A0AAJ5VW03_9HYPH|nr:GtrA family protein [Devosia sp.]WEK05131.1 MAG: GtrA family protein [Devosia sp.]
MSAALQSLMRDAPAARIERSVFAGLFAFLLVGGSGALAFVVLSTMGISLNPGVEAWQVNTVCYALTILPVYLLHRRFSFDSDASHWQALPRYVAVQAMALVLAALFSYVIHGMPMPTIFASMLVIALTSGVNFMVLRSWAFARSQMAVAIPA